VGVRLDGAPVVTRRAAAGRLALGLCFGASSLALTAPEPAWADAPGAGTWTTTQWLEAEGYPGTVGGNFTRNQCSGGQLRSIGTSGSPGVQFDITVPTGATHTLFNFVGASAVDRVGEVTITGGGGGTFAVDSLPQNIDLLQGCAAMTAEDFAPNEYLHLSEGVHTVSFAITTGTGAIALDRIAVTHHTPTPTTTTTTAPTTTTTVTPGTAWDGQSRPPGLLDDHGVMALGLSVALAAGAFAGRAWWGAP